MAGVMAILLLICYLPIRESIRGQQGKEISLESEESAETEDGRLEDTADSGILQGRAKLHTEDVEVSAGGAQAEGAAEMPEISFEIRMAEQTLETIVWKSMDGSCYLFLPGFVSEGGMDGKLMLASVEDGGYLQIGNAQFGEGDWLTGFAWEEAYPMTIYDGGGQAVLEAPLIFLSSSRLPVIAITTESGTMEEIEADKEVAEGGSVSVWDEDGTVVYEGRAKEIKGRGNSTFGLDKKPFQFRLAEKADLFGFGEAKAWNLLADGYDETGMRNLITMGLARALDMDFVPDGRIVDLYCNGEYYGMYYLSEKVEVGETRVAIRDMEEETEELYTKQQWENMETAESEDGNRKWAEVDSVQEDITGGYLIERELEERYPEEVSGFITKQGNIYALKSPKYASEEQVAYIAGKMQEFEDALEEEDGYNPDTGRHYTELIDLDSFVKKYLVEEISKNYDGGVTSSFFYKQEDSVSTKLYAGPVWDFDVAYGNCSLDKIASNPMGITKLDDHMWGTEIFVKLYEKEEFYKRIVELYEEKAVPYLEWLLESGIDQLSVQTGQSKMLNDIRWEELSNRHQYYQEYDNSVRYLKYFIRERQAFLDCIWLEEEVYHAVTFMVDGEVWKRVYIKDGERIEEEPIPSRYHSLFLGWHIVGSGVPFDEYKPVYEDITFYASFQERKEEETRIVPSGYGE